jgi:hypothetical protein
MSSKYVTVSKICVDVCRNDPVDIRAGGPEWLGFDFFVEDSLSDEMIKFIQVSLTHLNVPFANIYSVDKSVVNKTDVWNKERILEALNNQADYLRHEAARNYPAPSTRRKTN